MQVPLHIQVQVRVQKQKEWRLLGVRCSSSDSTTRGWAEKCSAAAAARGSFSTLGAGWVGAQGLGSAQYARTRQTATTLPQTFATESSGYGILGIVERCEVEGMHIGDI